MSDNKKYIALTLGPIYRTLLLAKSTKELWAASYLFSYLGKKIIEPFRKNTFVLPVVDDDRLWQPHEGAGLFPDRFIFEAEENDFEKLKEQVETVIYNLGKSISAEWNKPENEKTYVLFLRNYLKIYFFEFDADEAKPNLVEYCNRKLSLIEQQDNFNPVESKNCLQALFQNIKPQYFLAKDAYNVTSISGNRLFQSLFEIAIPQCRDRIEELINLYGGVKEDEILGTLRNEIEYFPHFSYVAIIKADGDNVGKTISALQQAKKPVIELAKQLFEFNLKVINVVNEYGGRAVYLGGDDLLIFAPLKCGNEHIFSLVEKINVAFGEAMRPFDIKPTLSFGISMIHFKSPMFEALERTDYLLNEKAKKQLHKNAIAFSLQKRSGHHIETVVSKSQCCIYETFKHIIDSLLDSPEKANDKSKILSSVMHWLGSNKAMLSVILNGKEPERTTRLSNYFSNSFNEKIHEQYHGFFQRLQTFVLNAYAHSGDIDTTIQTAYATLRFVHLLNSDKDE